MDDLVLIDEKASNEFILIQELHNPLHVPEEPHIAGQNKQHNSTRYKLVSTNEPRSQWRVSVGVLTVLTFQSKSTHELQSK